MNDVILQDAFDVARRHLADAVQPVHRHKKDTLAFGWLDPRRPFREGPCPATSTNGLIAATLLLAGVAVTVVMVQRNRASNIA